jgi:hypothetical protein
MCAIVLVASATVLLADDHTVLFDQDVDFSAFKTFALGDRHMESSRPELNFPAVMRSVEQAVRASLIDKGLENAPGLADLVATVDVKGVDYAIGPFGRPNAIASEGGGGRRGRGAPLAVDFTEITLVIDLYHGTPGVLVWRGVYHDTEKEARKLAESLPKDTAALLTEYPPKKSK